MAQVFTSLLKRQNRVLKKLKTILLIDDDYPTNFLHEIVLKDSGRVENIEAKMTADLGMAYLKESFEKNDSPELIFLDINLPAKDGFEFMEEYELLPDDIKSKSKIIMFSTSQNPQDIQKSKTYPSIEDIIVKPITEEIINSIINNYF